MTYDLIFPFFFGAALAFIITHPARFMPPRSEQRFFTVVIVLVAISFPLFPWGVGDTQGIWYELGAMAVVLALVALSRGWSAGWLALAYFVHGVWDLVSLLGVVDVHKPLWVVQLCVPFDWLVALYLWGRRSVWRS